MTQQYDNRHGSPHDRGDGNMLGKYLGMATGKKRTCKKCKG